MLLCRTRPSLQIRQNLGRYIFTLLSLRTWPLPFCKNLLCPAITHKATIVLPEFIRSYSTDGGKKFLPSVIARYEAISRLYRANLHELLAYVEIASCLAMTRFNF